MIIIEEESDQARREYYYKVIGKTFNVPDDVRKREEKRCDVEETDLILAFPLKPDGSADSTMEQKVFAYLPAREYGFKFIIQGDFLVPSNREDIHKDKAWNEFLRDRIAEVFLDAVEEFKKDEKLKKTYYSFIPLKGEVTEPFFSKAVEQIHTNLREKECILTESGNWKKPQDVFAADKEIRELIKNEELKEFFEKEYISSEIRMSGEIRDALGIEKFEVEHLIRCLENTEWLNKHGDEWFVNLYAFLSSKLSSNQFEKVKKLKILRLVNGELTSISDGVVFYSLDEKEEYGFEKELRILKSTILEVKEKEKEEAVREFLKNLGVRKASPYEIIENHILRIYESNDETTNWRSKDTKVLLGYVRYIKDHLEEYERESDKRLNANKRDWEKEDPLGRMKKTLFIRINKTIDGKNYYSHPEEIYLPKIYGNRYNLEELFDSIVDVEDVYFVHPEYIEGREKNEKEIKEWQAFFIKLGVSPIPRVISKKDTKTHKVYRGEELEKNVEEYTSPHICKVLEKNEWKRNEKLLEILDENWNYYKKYIQWNDFEFYYMWRAKPTNADWFDRICNTPWVPTTLNKLAKPSDVFLDKPEIRKLLGDKVPYLTVKIKNEDFIKALGFKEKVNVVDVCNLLLELVVQNCNDLSKFKRLYSFLNEHFLDDAGNIRYKFSYNKNKIIYIPDTQQKYFTANEVIWEDLSDIFGKDMVYLEKHYPDLRAFFVDKLGVSIKPKPEHYARLLITLSKKEEIENEDEDKILKIYKELEGYIFEKYQQQENNVHLISNENWWSEFMREVAFWTDKNEFRKKDNNLFVNDNDELYDLFKSNSEIAFLKLPRNYYPQIQHFIEAVGIPYLSHAVKIELALEEYEQPQENQELTTQIRGYIPYILRYLYRSAQDEYKKLNSSGVIAQLRDLTCYNVKNLRVKYVLSQEVMYSNRSCIIDNGKLYVQSSKLENTDNLAIELSKLFGNIRGLDDFIIAIFEKKTPEKIENFLKAKGIQELPETEQIEKSETFLLSPDTSQSTE